MSTSQRDFRNADPRGVRSAHHWGLRTTDVLKPKIKNKNMSKDKIEKMIEEGEGWDKIVKEHKEHYLKPEMPQIKSTDNSMLVTLFSTKEKFKEGEKIELTPRQKKILAYIEKEGRITTSLCSKFLKTSSDTSLRELTKMSKFGVITKKGKGKTSYYALR